MKPKGHGGSRERYTGVFGEGKANRAAKCVFHCVCAKGGTVTVQNIDGCDTVKG